MDTLKDPGVSYATQLQLTYGLSCIGEKTWNNHRALSFSQDTANSPNAHTYHLILRESPANIAETDGATLRNSSNGFSNLRRRHST